MSNKYNYCNNCGKKGHNFQVCVNPITSIGIICFRYNKNKEVEYLMINRKHSLGFVEFLRGKYPLNNYDYIVNIFNEMTIQEKLLLKEKDFSELWNDLWGKFMGLQYRSEEKKSKEKYLALKNGTHSKYNLNDIIDASTTTWNTPEWGFPKGRRNYQESDLNCALREFEEETGYARRNINVIQNMVPIEEIFTGSNMKSYKHRYFLAYLNNNEAPTNEFQESEVGKIEWLSYNDCISCIRPYNLEKLNMLEKINNIIHQYRLY
jgi:ADP-ribose pyrophosphatase YjhB (NUDIX family)